MMLVDYLDRGVHGGPDAPCLERPDGTVALTHAGFHDLTHRVAAALQRDGLRPGDRVAVFSPNDPLALACAVGVIRAGGVWVATNAANREAELSEFLDLAGCHTLVYHEALRERAEVLLADSQTVRSAVALGQGRPSDPDLCDWLAPAGTRVPDLELDSSRTVMFIGTGGTTGRSKAVPLTNRQVHLMSVAFDRHLHEPAPPRFICATPMTHAAGLACFPVIAHGGAVIVHDGVDAPAILTSIERDRATRLFLPPTALYSLLSDPTVRARDYSSLRQLFLAASPIAPERLAEAVDVFGPVVAQTFGQAEAPMICTAFEAAEIAEAAADPTLRSRLASCGRPSVVARVEIMAEDGTLLGPDQDGEIVIRSDLVFDGYWQNPEATLDGIRPGGWHGTGDIGRRDGDGFVYIVDRKKDMIITGGFNVYPSEVEAVVHTVDGVQDCAVIGVPDEKWGEAVTAVVEPRPDMRVDGPELIALCKSVLGSVKAPKTVIVRELPRSPVGKVLKRELRAEYWTTATRRI